MFFSAYRGSLALDESQGSTVTSGIEPLIASGVIWLVLNIGDCMSRYVWTTAGTRPAGFEYASRSESHDPDRGRLTARSRGAAVFEGNGPRGDGRCPTAVA